MASKNLAASGVLYTDRRKFYLKPNEYARLYPVVTPFISVLQGKTVRQTPDPDFKMFEHRSSWRYQYFLANGADAWGTAGAPGDTVTRAVDGAVGVTIDSSLLGTEVECWDSTETTYKGNMLVTAVSGSDVTFTSVGNPTDSSFQVGTQADNDVLRVVGTAFGEGTAAPDAASDELEVVWNSCQEQKTTLQINDVLRDAALRGEGDELARLRMEKGMEHKIKLARTMYFGMRPTGIGGTANAAGGGTDSTFISHITDASSNTVRKTMGIIPILKRYGRTTGDQQNYFQRAFGSYDYDQFVEDSDKMFQYFPNDGFLTAMVGPDVLNFFSKVGAEGFMSGSTGTRIKVDFTAPRQAALGFNFRELHTPSGVVRLVPEPLFRGTPYSKYMVVLNLDNVQMVQFQPDEYTADILKDNNPRYQKDEYFSNSGLGVELVESHSLFQFS